MHPISASLRRSTGTAYQWVIGVVAGLRHQSYLACPILLQVRVMSEPFCIPPRMFVYVDRPGNTLIFRLKYTERHDCWR